jgi:hypothetical protein
MDRRVVRRGVTTSAGRAVPAAKPKDVGGAGRFLPQGLGYRSATEKSKGKGTDD